MEAILIENWSVVTRSEPHIAPEIRDASLNGVVYGHPKFPNGDEIITSQIVEADGRMVRTYSGSLYKLGSPSKMYLDWLQHNGIAYNEEQPIRTREV
jgi:hypothetical protein